MALQRRHKRRVTVRILEWYCCRNHLSRDSSFFFFTLRNTLLDWQYCLLRVNLVGGGNLVLERQITAQAVIYPPPPKLIPIQSHPMWTVILEFKKKKKNIYIELFGGWAQIYFNFAGSKADICNFKIHGTGRGTPGFCVAVLSSMVAGLPLACHIKYATYSSTFKKCK